MADTPPVAQLVECAPAEPEVLSVDVSAPRESPIHQAMHETIEQTGAGPPPEA